MQVFAGRYQLVDVLGRGGMGDVWRVWDLRDGAYRAAKLQRQADSASLLRFVRESATRIDHPHVVAPTGWSAEDDTVLFAMPVVGGGSVAQLVADHGPLPPWWVRTLGLQLLDALDAVHAAGLVHRDVKPANLLLEPTGTGHPHLRLSDFGIAASPDEPRLTRAAEVVHTPGYSAPEARTGADPDPRQDLWSVGVVLGEMLTGRRPGAEPELPPSGPFAELLRRLVAVDPANRPPSARAAAEELAAVVVDEPEGEPVEVFDHLPPWPEGWGPSGPVPAGPPAPPTAPALPAPPTPPARDAAARRAARRADRRRVGWAPAALALLGVALLAAAAVTGLR